MQSKHRSTSSVTLICHGNVPSRMKYPSFFMGKVGVYSKKDTHGRHHDEQNSEIFVTNQVGLLATRNFAHTPEFLL